MHAGRALHKPEHEILFPKHPQIYLLAVITPKVLLING